MATAMGTTSRLPITFREGTVTIVTSMEVLPACSPGG